MANPSPRPTSPIDTLELASRLGVPFVILLIVLWQITPRIDHQTEIADRTAAYLGVLVARPPLQGCVTP